MVDAVVLTPPEWLEKHSERYGVKEVLVWADKLPPNTPVTELYFTENLPLCVRVLEQTTAQGSHFVDLGA